MHSGAFLRVQRCYQFPHNKQVLSPLSVFGGFKQQMIIMSEMLSVHVLEDKCCFSSLNIVDEALLD